MNKIVSKGLWSEIAKLAKRASSRKAAIAYVTKDFLALRKGDLLVVDASPAAIGAGETSALLLKMLFRRGVKIVSCPGLHSKVVSFGNMVAIGSANMSDSSANNLIEVMCISDNQVLISGVQSIIHQLAEKGTVQTAKAIAVLLQIKVRSGRFSRSSSSRRIEIESLGNKTWMLGVHELKDGAFEAEAGIAAAGETRAEKIKKLKTSSISWIRWSGKDRVRKELKSGDSVIEIWRPLGRKQPTYVYRNSVVLSRQEEKSCCRIYIEEQPRFERDKLSWNAFGRMLKKIGFPRTPGPNSRVLVEDDWADLIQKNWKGI